MPNQNPSLEYDPNLVVYTLAPPDGNGKRAPIGWTVAEIPTLLAQLSAENKPVILFIHGRGSEPKKSLVGTGFIVSAFGVKGMAVANLESQYNARVVMFSWDSERGGFLFINLKDRDKPLAQIGAASASLAAVLKAFAQYRVSNNPSNPFVLLAHSMGTIVLQNVLAHNAGGPTQDLWPAMVGRIFNTVVINSADADHIGHDQWVQRLATRERVFVSINADDKTLKKSTDGRPPLAHALGRDPRPTLAVSASYFEITDLDIDEFDNKGTGAHELFNKGRMSKQVHVCELYSALLAGRAPTLVLNTNVDRLEPVGAGVIYHIKRNVDGTHACFT